ncbi:restriction system protein [Natronospira proteinivora]|uniref:Restriction system protein n=1 Tax=Natronospira proteinivora TaxID=1807133 RepID=A0ABT1GBF1_9GAMM|nr:restriction endonuclease [Natronospira proteinivora]MCP1727598.1 restriction system protein [Natronospira proteinivora]
MAKRSQSIFVDMVYLPWWVGVIFGILFLIVGLVFVPALLEGQKFVGLFTVHVQWFVYFLAFLSFLSATVSVGRSWWQGKLFYKMKGGQPVESLSWRDFEQMLAGAFREQGYLVADNPPGPDEGIDLRLRKGREKIYVQAKHWHHKPVGVSVIREHHGVVTAAGVDAGIVVSSSGFTPDAKRFAKKAGVRLIGPVELRRWFTGQSPKSEPQNTAGIERRSKEAAAPDCPACKTPMVARTARRSPNAGQQFWGCPNFPNCRQTRPFN